ncbi:MAG: tRNA (N6-threonylcarbamoyladenosine(37)-N6)-methyltransferase TrmO [Dehalococcoidia bacterium]|nr:tRNA (N6-threonylcarbamoyladenosine(37)-N6)-methyltransferase TrmO [Dehalococcoidia bacterium]
MTNESIELKPVGVIRTTLSNDEIRDSWPEGIRAEIEVFEVYADALDGIEGFSHLMILFYLHEASEAQKRTLRARPKRFLRLGLRQEDLPLVGVFCLDSPHRPNPLGLTIVRLLSRKGNVLMVDGLDAFNNTPVLDIKPYTPERCVSAVQLPDWYRLLQRHLQANKASRQPGA